MLRRPVFVRRIPKFLGLFSCFAAAALNPRTVQANGAFPAVSQLVADPSDPTHLVLRSNFGLLISHDRGVNWDLVCEAGLGYQNIEPAIAVLGDGTTLVALPEGIARGTTECAFERGAGLEGYVADVARIPGLAGGAAVAISVDIEAGLSRVWRSLDAGQSWKRAGSALSALNATTLDAAGEAGSTLYVSGTSQEGALRGVLAHSSDGGETWTRSDVPGSNKQSIPYIAAVSAQDPETVFVRLSGNPGQLLVSHDRGASFTRLLDFAGPLDGFALSPDGRYALASGRMDGVWRADTSDLVFERVSCTKLRCLSWTSAGLFSCAEEFQAGFLVGESANAGLTFEPRLHLSCVRGPLACASVSTVAKACDAAWPALSEVLGSDCSNAGFTPQADCSELGSSTAGAGAIAGSGSIEVGLEPRARGGCSLAASPASRWIALSSLGTLLCGMGRRRASSRKRGD